jgi:hypothetical protein
MAYDACQVFIDVLSIFAEAQERHWAKVGTPTEQAYMAKRARGLKESRKYDARTPADKKAYRDAHKEQAKIARRARDARRGN